MQIFSNLNEITHYLNNITQKIALVPTMGGLHAGHISLIELAKQHAEVVVVSIFVNPAQFGENEDFSQYPRTLEQDLELLKANDADVVFIPNISQIYPDDFIFNYQIGDLEQILCGFSRPTHFAGVVKVVYRLFDIIKPDVAVFGKKDYQQLTIIKKMVSDLELPVAIIAGDIVRDEDALALSTRNNYLTKSELKTAKKLNKIISSITNFDDKDLAMLKIEKELKELFNLDYCVLLDANNLGKISVKTTEIIILVAVKLGSTRLIDNFIFRN
jgi:pantoate--beta-alanine ligase